MCVGATLPWGARLDGERYPTSLPPALPAALTTACVQLLQRAWALREPTS